LAFHGQCDSPKVFVYISATKRLIIDLIKDKMTLRRRKLTSSAKPDRNYLMVSVVNLINIETYFE